MKIVEANAIAFANGFVERARKKGRQLSPIEVLKLTYIAHGWSLALLDRELFGDEVQAWKFGPVIPILYQATKFFGNGPVTQAIKHPYFPGEYDGMQLSNVENELLDRVYQVYGHLKPFQLSGLTHQKGTPWDKVWNKQGGKRMRDAVIPNPLIQKHFKELAKKRGGCR